MKYGSVCSGIEAASVAWHPLGWEAQWLSEIEAFPSAVLAHHYPTVPNLGDMTKFKDWPDAAIDLLVGGTPCQSFSVAGLRKGLADPRGNLMLTYLAIAARFTPRWLVWENVPGVLSSNEGRDFGSLLGGLAELGYGFAYRVLDAQYFGVAQRRRRVFVVGYFGDWRPAAAVLFERESMRGDSAPRREARKSIAPTLSARTKGGGGLGTDFDCDGGLIPQIARTLTTSNQRIDAETETLLVAHSLRGEGFDASEDGTGRGTPLVPVAFDCKSSGQNGFGIGEIASTMRSMGHSNSHQNGGGHQAVAIGAAVRRLTPRECERLQGFPDDYTDIPVRVTCLAPAGSGPCAKQTVTATIVTESGRHFVGTNHCMTPQPTCARAGMETGVGYELCKSVCNQDAHAEVNAIKVAGKAANGGTLYLQGHTYACDSCKAAAVAAGIVEVIIDAPPGNAADGPRYKALGNSMAVPVMHWIGSRIQLVEETLNA